MRIMVDGYNLIRRVPELAMADRQDLEEGRNALIESLAQYRAGTGHKLTIVFDGAGSWHQSSRGEKVRGMTVIYSRQGKSADEVIVEMCRDGKADVLVTADVPLQKRAESAGVVCAYPERMWDRVQEEVIRKLKGLEPEDDLPAPVRTGRKLKKKDRRARNLLSRL